MQYTVLSALLLSLGMIIRICRLYPTPLQICDRVRQKFSNGALFLLESIKKGSNYFLILSPGLETFVYWPLVAVYHCYHLSFDLVTSKAFEVRCVLKYPFVMSIALI